MYRLLTSIALLAVLIAALAGVRAPVSAQSADDKPEKPAKEDAKEEGEDEKKGEEEDEENGDEPVKHKPVIESAPGSDGDTHDRPGGYPQIRFGGKRGGEEGEGADWKSRVYLLDVSDAMARSVDDDNPETTRLDHMIKRIEGSLDAMTDRGDPDLRFNIVTFGEIDDFADGEELVAATPETVKRAQKWLAELKAGGTSDMYGMLKECFEQEPDSATMIVGARPVWPEDVSDDVKAAHTDAGEYLLAEVKRWRRSGKSTTLDITGVGLSGEEVKYFKRLAEAAGGTYLDA